MQKIKVGIVNYLNTKPLLYGIEHSTVMSSIDLIPEYPARIAAMLLEGRIDLGLVPVTVIPRMKEYHIVTDYCIGCDGPVASVALFSDVPITQAERLLLDYQSRTSVDLTKILLNHFWKISPKLIDTKSDYRSRIKGKTAGLIIGDRALEQRKISPYIYDLGEAWKNFTSLPFVFAAWISNKRLPEQFINDFNEANRTGVNSIEKVIASTHYDLFDLEKFYTKFISYPLDEAKRKGMQKFLQLLEEVVSV